MDPRMKLEMFMSLLRQHLENQYLPNDFLQFVLKIAESSYVTGNNAALESIMEMNAALGKKEPELEEKITTPIPQAFLDAFKT